MVIKASQEYTQKDLRTYLSVLKLILDWNSHAPGPGEETDIDSLIVTGAVAVGSVKVFTIPGQPQRVCFRLNSLLYVSQIIYDGH